MPPHALGPHVVGQRVVVRRVLRGETGPSGGPARTDVLGVCTSWGDGACVVVPESGPTVTIPLSDIVAGKPVPSRPSPRLRVSPADAQRRAFALWPDLVTEPLGNWLLRRSPTATARRANSVLAMGPSGRRGACDDVVGFYRAVGQRPIAAVLPGSPEDDLFCARGWISESADAPTVFELAGVAEVVRGLPQSAEAATLVEEGDLVTARIGDRASGVAVLSGDWVGFRTIDVAPGFRRRGLGLAVMATLVRWAAERGAVTAYLQVLGGNAPALALYDRLGFREHHRYRYLAAPQPPDSSAV